MYSSIPKFLLIAAVVAILTFITGLPNQAVLLDCYEVFVVFLGAIGFSAVMTSVVGTIIYNFNKELVAISFFGSLVSYLSLLGLVSFPNDGAVRFKGLKNFFEIPESYGILVLVLFGLAIALAVLCQLKHVIEEHYEYKESFNSKYHGL